jgi:hypothetical protein
MCASEPLEPIGENVCSSWSSVDRGRDSWELPLKLDDGSGVGGRRTLRGPFLTRSLRQNGLKPDQQALSGFNTVRGDSGRISRRGLAEDFNEGAKSE